MSDQDDAGEGDASWIDLIERAISPSSLGAWLARMGPGNMLTRNEHAARALVLGKATLGMAVPWP